ncbi:MAG: addiction module protein [Candidatus Angelobacter sp.]
MTNEDSNQFAWDQEIARRIDELDSGKAKTIPWDEVQRRIAAKLNQRHSAPENPE